MLFKNPLVIISVNSGIWVVMVVCLAIETWLIIKGDAKIGGWKGGWGEWGKRFGSC
jgi:hypothetical protein